MEDFFGTSGYVPQDSRNLAGSYGNSEFDQRRALIFTYIYALPSPKLHGALGYVLKDWQVSGTTTMRDGLAAPLLTFGDESGVGNFHTRFDCVGSDSLPVEGFTQPYASGRVHLLRLHLELLGIARAIPWSLRDSMHGTSRFREHSGFTSATDSNSEPAFSTLSTIRTLPSLRRTSIYSHHRLGGRRQLRLALWRRRAAEHSIHAKFSF